MRVTNTDHNFLDECLYKLYALEYDKIDVSERIGVSKTSGFHERNVCRYWTFLEINF